MKNQDLEADMAALEACKRIHSSFKTAQAAMQGREVNDRDLEADMAALAVEFEGEDGVDEKADGSETEKSDEKSEEEKRSRRDYAQAKLMAAIRLEELRLDIVKAISEAFDEMDARMAEEASQVAAGEKTDEKTDEDSDEKSNEKTNEDNDKNLTQESHEKSTEKPTATENSHENGKEQTQYQEKKNKKDRKKKKRKRKMTAEDKLWRALFADLRYFAEWAATRVGRIITAMRPLMDEEEYFVLQNGVFEPFRHMLMRREGRQVEDCDCEGCAGELDDDQDEDDENTVVWWRQ
ncbi:hypothetical protein CkaCkLH20_03358 [Colletotrichum karsti]|uniref:Uncharacterized protein n=1 Tax=Colletotrichum karsti TaxID=1095194 RepID=A0A9P6IAT8_9PEZI|nr:uncharacterized protein CkaCkLH20_03358 [Colletotrichum karsti]KAF9879125.1 hypothetical protein CkaCkLH20_03358 [Colletotrichum karsti]